MHIGRTIAFARRIGALATLALAVAAPAWGDEARRLGAFGAWEAYAYSDAAGKVCYAAARADKTNGGEARRAASAMAVTHRAKSPGEVSLLGAYGFKKGSDAEIQIGGMKHTFFTRADSAWARNAAADKAIIAAMIKGRDVVVRGTPAKGAAVVDTVPLTGFSDALAAIDKACGVKR